MFIIVMSLFNLRQMEAPAVELHAYGRSDLILSGRKQQHCVSITCNREHSVEAAVSVRQMQPVTHLDLVSLAPGKVHQGATNIAPQLEHFLVNVEILAIATACQGEDEPTF